MKFRQILASWIKFVMYRVSFLSSSDLSWCFICDVQYVHVHDGTDLASRRASTAAVRSRGSS